MDRRFIINVNRLWYGLVANDWNYTYVGLIVSLTFTGPYDEDRGLRQIIACFVQNVLFFRELSDDEEWSSDLYDYFIPPQDDPCKSEGQEQVTDG